MAVPGAVPGKKTNEVSLDAWNQAFRSSPEYVEFMQSIGVDPSGPIRLSDSQREQFKRYLQTKGIALPSGMEIDPAGNLNQNEGVGKYATNPWVLGGLAAGSMLIPGVGPAVLGGLKSAGAGIGKAVGIGGGAGGAGSAAGTATGAAAGGSLYDKILRGGSTVADLLGAGRDVLGASADTAAHNRGVAMDAQQAEALFNLKQDEDYRNALIAREREGRESGTDAQRKLQQAEYIANNQGYSPISITTGGQSRKLPAYGFGPTQSTEAEKAGAVGIRGEALKRLEGGNQLPAIPEPIPFEFEDKEPSTFEEIAQWTVPGLSIWEAIERARKGRKTQPVPFGGNDDWME